jgi:hypothetical protein
MRSIESKRSVSIIVATLHLILDPAGVGTLISWGTLISNRLLRYDASRIGAKKVSGTAYDSTKDEGLLGPSFAETGDEMRRQDRSNTLKKKGEGST